MSLQQFAKSLGRLAFRKIQISCNAPYYLARTSCLTNNALATLTLGLSGVQFRELRVDAISDYIEGCYKRPPLSYNKYFNQRWSIHLADQHLFSLSKRHSPEFIIMDSFPELSVQKFTPSNSDRSFFSYFSLIKSEAVSNGALTVDGLLPIERIEAAYQRFFEGISRYYPKIRIIFLHYPLKYEQREIFLQRSAAIHDAINKIRIQHSNLTVLETPDHLVLPRPGDSSPFHFAAQTYQHIGQHIRIAI